MGEAFTGVLTTSTAILLEPGRLATLKHPGNDSPAHAVVPEHKLRIRGLRVPTEEAALGGMAVTNLHTDDINRRTTIPNPRSIIFGSSDNAYLLSYAYPLSDRCPRRQWQYIRRRLIR